MVIVVLFGAQVALRLTGTSLVKQTPEEVSTLLKPFYRLSFPDGEGPFPTALLASGCDGPKDNLETWTTALNAEGWATMVVDSHTPRGYHDDPAWRLVCSGAVMPGGVRAGDLAVALADARALPEIDASKLVLIGASHGGWSVLDLLALADARRLPENLRRWPNSASDNPLEGVVAVIAVYPYCGEASRVKHTGWQRPVPVLFSVVEDDTIVDSEDCLAVALRAQNDGLPVEIELFSNVTHGFDQQDKAVFSLLTYDKTATSRLTALMTEFLNQAIR